MSKRSYRRVAVVAGAALALGSMAPALAHSVDVDGVADVDVSVSSPGGVSSAALPIGIPSTTDALILAGYANSLILTDVAVVNNMVKTDVVSVVGSLSPLFAAVGSLGDDCGLVNVLSCNNGSPLHLHNNELNILSDGGPGASDLGLGLLEPAAPVLGIATSTVGTVLGTVGAGGAGGLGGLLLDPHVGLLAAVGLSL